MPKVRRFCPKGTAFSQLILNDFIMYVYKLYDICFFILIVVPVVLVGNKKDVRNDKSAKLAYNLKTTYKRNGLEMSYNIGAYDYLECSAKLNDGVKEVFDAVIRAEFE